MRSKSCPSADDLVRFTAGDLPQGTAANIQTHVRHCLACRAQLRDWDDTLEAYRKHAPGAGEDLPRWETFDDALRQEENSWHLERAKRSRHQWAAAAAIVATVLGTAWLWQRTEIVLNAEEVIIRVVRQEGANPLFGAEPVWIREADTRAGTAIGMSTPAEAIDGRSHGISDVVSNRGRVAQELAGRLAAYGFNWAAPLSAQPLQRWRAASQRAEDHIVLLNPGLLKVSMTTAAGPIRQAEIVVRKQTYEPVSQYWRFADGFNVELTSVKPDEPSLPRPPVVADGAPKPLNSGAAPVDIEAVELDLRSTLQRLGAPVGSALAIRHTRDRVHVEGAVATAETARQITAYAHGRRAVDARVTVGAVSPDRDLTVSADLRAWLDQALPNEKIRETFVGRTWKLLDHLQISIRAFEELGRRYNNDQVAVLSPDEQRQLRDLAAAQYSEVTGGYEALERQLAPLLGTVSRPVIIAGLPSNWRQIGAAARRAIDQLTDGLATVLASAVANEPTEAFDERAREALRPSLEALAGGITGQG